MHFAQSRLFLVKRLFLGVRHRFPLSTCRKYAHCQSITKTIGGRGIWKVKGPPPHIQPFKSKLKTYLCKLAFDIDTIINYCFIHLAHIFSVSQFFSLWQLCISQLPNLCMGTSGTPLRYVVVDRSDFGRGINLSSRFNFDKYRPRAVYNANIMKLSVSLCQD